MKVRLTFDYGVSERNAIAWHVGGTKPASRAAVAGWIRSTVEATMQVLVAEYDTDHSCDNCGCHEHEDDKCDTCDCDLTPSPEAMRVTRTCPSCKHRANHVIHPSDVRGAKAQMKCSHCNHRWYGYAPVATRVSGRSGTQGERA